MQTFYQTSFNEGFYLYNGIGELTVPTTFIPQWREDAAQNIKRPEYKPKSTAEGQPEVHTAPFAASIGMTSCRHYGVLSKQLVGIKAGTLIRASVWVMGVSHHSDGQVGGGLGQSIGIGEQGWQGVVYDTWWSSDLPTWSERQWALIQTETVAAQDNPWVHLRSDAREPFQTQYSHFDDLQILVEGSATPLPPPPPPGPIYEDGEALIAYADTLAAIESGLRDIATRIGNATPARVGELIDGAVTSLQEARALV